MLANWLADCGQVRDDALVRRLESEVADAVRQHATLPPEFDVTDRTSA
jgi:para-aminobenzoate synthetase component 2